MKPTFKKVNESTHDSVETHPAYGMIGASRVTGNVSLYGSDFNHHHFVTISIHRSKLHRGLSNDWVHPEEELIEVALSEAQWATFVSAMNVGHGVQCTIQHIAGERVPKIDAPPDRRGQFKMESNERIESAIRSMDTIREKIAASRLSGKAEKELVSMVDRVEAELTSNQAFVAKQFSEHIEKIIEHGKIEINAHIQATLMRAGLESIKSATPIGFLESGAKP